MARQIAIDVGKLKPEDAGLHFHPEILCFGDIGGHQGFYSYSDTWNGGFTSVFKMGHEPYAMKLAFKELSLSRAEVARQTGRDPGYLEYLEERPGASPGIRPGVSQWSKSSRSNRGPADTPASVSSKGEAMPGATYRAERSPSRHWEDLVRSTEIMEPFYEALNRRPEIR